MKSYLLLELSPHFKEEVKQRLQRYDFTIDRVNDISGTHNVLAQVVTDDKIALKNFVSKELNGMLGVKKVNTVQIT